MMKVLFLFSVFISSISQIFLKKGSNEKNLYLNKFTIFGYSILLLSTLCTAIAYKEVAISLGVIFESLSYIFVPVLSLFILKEKINKHNIIGMILILIGIFLFSL